MRLILTTLGLTATALAGHASTSKAPGVLLTGCPNGYTNIMTGECKPYHLRIRSAATNDWASHKVTDAYHVADHVKGSYPAGKDGYAGAHFTGPSGHCPNGVSNHASGECKPFRMHARDADSGEWKEHFVTGAYKIPDEKAGKGGFGGAHSGEAGKMGAGKGGMFGGANSGQKGGW